MIHKLCSAVVTILVSFLTIGCAHTHTQGCQNDACSNVCEGREGPIAPAAAVTRSPSKWEAWVTEKPWRQLMVSMALAAVVVFALPSHDSGSDADCIERGNCPSDPRCSQFPGSYGC